MKYGVILSLCDFSGTWSAPYREAGYHVIQVDLQLGQDVRLLKYPGKVHGILAAPPCDHFARVGAQHWARKGEAALLEGLSIADACLRFVVVCKPEWWVLENPIGRIKDYLGEPVFKFHPWEFGDPWTKRTHLWGDFTPPMKTPCEYELIGEPGRRDRTTKLLSKQKNERSKTPQGFARAFFKANP